MCTCQFFESPDVFRTSHFEIIGKIFQRFSCFFMTYANTWSKKIYAKKHRNRRQNNFPLKAPACVHIIFFSLQMYLDPPISLLMEAFSLVFQLFLYDVRQ